MRSKNIAFLFLALVMPLLASAQGTGTFIWTNGVPTATPCGTCAKFAVDQNTYIWYEWTGVSWKASGDRVQTISGCSKPLYTPTKNLSNVAVNGCDSLYYYRAGAWRHLNKGGGANYTAGEGVAIDGTVIRLDTVDRLTFNQSPVLSGGIGTLRWNDTDGTLDLGLKGGNVTLQLGQEQNTLVKHADNAGLANGAAVYVVGSDGTNKTVRLARANIEATSALTLGVMTESTTGGNKGFCTTFGYVRNINTAALTEGSVVWLSATTAGGLTTTRPTAPNHGVQIGFCIRSHATLGVIFVSVQNGHELNELHDVAISGPTNGQALTYNSSLGVWQNSTLPDVSSTNEIQTLSLTGQDLSLSLGGGTVTLPAGVEWPLLAPDATSTAPSYSFTNATTTGMYYDGAAYNFRGPVLDLRTFSATEEDAGGINIFSGNSIDRAGGNILIQSGQSTNGTGGTFEFYSGASTNGGGGSFLMQAGASTNGGGGTFTANAGDGAVGGNFLLRAGNTALDEESGGSFELRAGNSIGVSGSGGQFSAIGGDGDFLGGNVTIQGGNGASGIGGSIILGGGLGASTALRGVVQINANGLDITGMTTEERDAMPISSGNYRIIFNTTANKFQGYANGTWVDFH